MMAKKEWHKEDLQQDVVRELNRNLELDTLLGSIFARRAHTEPEELLYFLEKSTRYLHNPYLLNEMHDAVERMLSAIEEGENILIFGDRDVDGISATVLLYHGLLALGVAPGKLSFRNPTANDAYGLSLCVVEEASGQGVTLILTADCGCANHSEIAAARELGIDTIVLDHHSPKEQRPVAYALVNPHSADEEGRSYPFSGICAASVSGKFLWALAYLKESGPAQCFCLLDIVIQEIGGDSQDADPDNPQVGRAALDPPRVSVRAAKIQNLCVQSQLQIEIGQTLGEGRKDRNHVANEAKVERLYQYIQSEVLCSFTPTTTRQALKEIFGFGSEIYLLNLCEQLLRQSPRLAESLRQSGALQNSALLRRELLRLSSLARYRKLDFFDSQVELLISMLGRQVQLPRQILKQSLDMMAIASIADMMPLQNENRIIVALGLSEISRKPRPGLRELLLQLGLLGQEISSKELSWKIIPILNAAGRMGNTALVTSLFTTQSSEERRKLAHQLVELNQERRKQSEKFLALAKEPAEKSFTESSEQLVYVAIPELPRGITGLIAGRLSQQYSGIPCVVLAQNPEKSSWSGSLRSSGDPSVLALLDPLADYFPNYGGHQAAGGFSVSTEKQKQLWSAFLQLLPLATLSEEEEAKSRYDIDAEIPLGMLNQDLLQRLWLPLAPYGMDWPELLLLSRGLILEDLQPIGQSDAGHLKLFLQVPGQRTEKAFNAVFWHSAERYPKDFTKGDVVDILYHIQANHYQGRMRFQLEIVDIHRSS